ncbi:hypothetical protein DFA_10068 [Cavenderia fasciculata]|uniref:Uncharacterized protein n=1 Tax=Cavenderia fasciculata TaxID=261658 RepID=F4Q967_CACFS|nr:uncharacterized protein DFA_10068 [Cavenderia fasciculata]EGG15236.1 hypothetical protein DFA_10068 [Cavenderia fasciculata]|eukprot:XP_004351956.1 hypothetical protein DFA_10068 [Cavenderia fasciculata]
MKLASTLNSTKRSTSIERVVIKHTHTYYILPVSGGHCKKRYLYHYHYHPDTRHDDYYYYYDKN